VKGKLITNAKEPYIYTAMDTAELIEQVVDQVPTVGYLNQTAITTNPADRDKYTARNMIIEYVGNPTIYFDAMVRTIPDPLEENVF